MYKEIATEETALPKWLAARDVAQRNAANVQHYTPAQQQQLNGFYARVCSAYSATVYKNFRKQFMVVKVNKPSKANLLSAAVRELDYYAAQNAIDIVRSKTAVLYRIAA